MKNYCRVFTTLLYITNKEGKIIYFNPLLSQKTNFLEEELYALYIHQLYSEELAFDVKKILDHNEQEIRLLYPLMTSNKEMIPAETIVSKVVWSGRNMLLWSIRDLKERKKVEEKLALSRKRTEEVNIAKTAFLTNLSFALRNSAELNFKA